MGDEPMAGIALFTVSAALIVWGSARLAARFGGFRHERLLATYVIAAASIVLSAEVLALGSLLNSRIAWISASAVIAALGMTFGLRNPSLQNQDRVPLTWPLIGVAAAYAGFFVTGLLLPANNSDAMAYHLARVGYYLQQGNFSFFETNDTRQVSMQINAEILQLWTVALLRRDWLTPVVQWTAALAGALAIFGICRRLRFPRAFAMLGALLFLGYPQVTTQATSPKNDLLSAVLLIAAVHWILAFKDTGARGHASLAGVSAGLAAGCKATIWLFFPGVAILAVHACFGSRRVLAGRAVTLFVAPFAGTAIFVLPHLIRTELATGHPLVRETDYLVESIGFRSAGSNLTRLAFDVVNAADLPEPAHRCLTDAKHSLAKVLQLPDTFANAPGTSFHDLPFTYGGGTLSEEFAWFGVSGLLVFLGAIIAVLRAARHRQTGWLCYAAVPLGYLVAYSALLRWQPWGGRFLIGVFALLLPLGMKGWMRILTGVRRPMRRAAWGALYGLALCGCVVALLQNRNKPLIPTAGLRTVWSLSREEQRCRALPMNAALMRCMNSLPPSRIGVYAPDECWDRLLFAEDFRHTVHRYRQMPDLRRVFTNNECEFFVLGFDAGAIPEGIESLRLNETWQILSKSKKTMPAWPP